MFLAGSSFRKDRARKDRIWIGGSVLENDLELIIGMGYERKLRQIDDENRVVWVEPKKNYWDGVYDGEIVGKPWSG